MKRHFMTDLTHFFELTENIRARQADGVLSPFASALSNLRVGQLNQKDQLLLNERFCSPDFAMEHAHPKAIWIYATNGECKKFNDMCTDRLADAGNFRIRIVAQHKDKREQTATLEQNARLLNIPLKTKKQVRRSAFLLLIWQSVPVSRCWKTCVFGTAPLAQLLVFVLLMTCP